MGCFRIKNLRVVDLTDLDVLNMLGYGWADLQHPWDYQVTQEIGTLLFSNGVDDQVDGLIAPAARCEGHTMIVVRETALENHVEYIGNWTREEPPHYLSRFPAHPPM
jgi:hypothetical protein